jgi:molybdopterin converting factor subunit 1
MDVEIRLFATLKDRAGQARIRINMPESATVQQLLQIVADDFPSLAEALKSSLVAVNQAFASSETAVHADDEIAIFPPVSGGSQAFPHPTYFAITADELDLNAVQTRLTQPDVGAIVSFTGSVRGQTEREGLPGQTLYLEYESYASMAEAKMTQIAREIWSRWPLVKGIAIVQRIGRLDVGEITTFVACAAGHRDQGVFDAARYGIDRLKEIVPVWKKEVGADQSVWVEGDYRPTEADNQ